MTYLDRLSASLEAVRNAGRYRSVEPYQLEGVIDFSSNDYLGLATNAQVTQAMQRATRVGSGGARLLGGRHREHSLLEEELAKWLGRERVLLFSSGYHAALGAIPVLATAVQMVYSDALNHASLIDGVRLAHVPREVFAHAQLPPRDERLDSALVVTESIFSMDGDAVDLDAILADLGNDDVLLVDEAHALGIVGEQGAGRAAHLRDPRVVVLGTLSKSFGAHGGFIAGPAVVIEMLVNAARSFIFDTALPPAIALAGRVALSLIRGDDEGRRAIHRNVAHLRAGLRSLGLPAIDDLSPIVPVILGDERRTLGVADELLKKKTYAPAIRPPTVPPGTSRLRISVRSNHSLEAIDLLLGSVRQCIATS
jgi:8-amino-7-oxononanoate synthase